MATTSSQLSNNLANLLPTGTFMAFQTLAPVFTDNGVCGVIEQSMTATLVLIFSLLCFLLSFTDSLTTKNGHVYHGIVTTKGLYNPQFKLLLSADSNFYVGPEGSSRYFVRTSDFVNASLSVVCFCTISLLTPPLTNCLYPGVPNTITRTMPVIVGLLVAIVFGFSPPGRHGVGFSSSMTTGSNVEDTWA